MEPSLAAVSKCRKGTKREILDYSIVWTLLSSWQSFWMNCPSLQSVPSHEGWWPLLLFPTSRWDMQWYGFHVSGVICAIETQEYCCPRIGQGSEIDTVVDRITLQHFWNKFIDSLALEDHLPLFSDNYCRIMGWGVWCFEAEMCLHEIKMVRIQTDLIQVVIGSDYWKSRDLKVGCWLQTYNPQSCLGRPA